MTIFRIPNMSFTCILCLCYSIATLNISFLPLSDGFLLNSLQATQSKLQIGQINRSQRGSKCGSLHMQSEWFNVKAFQDLKQKIQQKKTPEVDAGPRVILGETPWGRYLFKMFLSLFAGSFFSRVQILSIECRGLWQGQRGWPSQ
jgi:hypothetical protein